MADTLPPPPTDLFSSLTPTIDSARSAIAALGLRTYRVYMLRERFSEPKRSGEVLEREWVEILPPPEVRAISVSRIASAAGTLVDGSVELVKITRTLRREELLGRTIYGDDPPQDERRSIALLALGQHKAELFNPAGEPILEPLGWRMILNPTNRREVAPGPQ